MVDDLEEYKIRSPDDVDPYLPDEVKLVIADLVLQWARYDSLLSQLVIHAYGLSLDTGSMLISAMSTDQKFDRLISVYKHFGLEPAVKSLQGLRSAHGKIVSIRNLVAHALCAGRLKTDLNYLVFAPVRALKGEPDKMLVESVHISALDAAVNFAKGNGDQLKDLIDKLAESRNKLRTK